MTEQREKNRDQGTGAKEGEAGGGGDEVKEL